MKAKILHCNLRRKRARISQDWLRGSNLYRGRLANDEVRYTTKTGLMEVKAGEYSLTRLWK